MPKTQGQKSSKGVPRKSRSASRKARRAKNKSLQPEKKLRRMLKRNNLRDAFEWADSHNELAMLRSLCPDFQKQLAAIGKGE